MLIVTLHENDKPIGTLRIGRVSGAPNGGPHNDYAVAWEEEGTDTGTVRRGAVYAFDRSRKALALVVEAVKALGLE